MFSLVASYSKNKDKVVRTFSVQFKNKDRIKNKSRIRNKDKLVCVYI